MSSGVVSDREEILATYAEWEAVNAKVDALSLDALADTELLELQHRREVAARSVPTVDHQIINRLAAEARSESAWRHESGRCAVHATAHQ